MEDDQRNILVLLHQHIDRSQELGGRLVLSTDDISSNKVIISHIDDEEIFLRLLALCLHEICEFLSASYYLSYRC